MIMIWIEVITFGQLLKVLKYFSIFVYPKYLIVTHDDITGKILLKYKGYNLYLTTVL